MLIDVPGDKITVPVEVTYPDGSKDNVDVTVTVDEPDAPAKKPDWEDSNRGAGYEYRSAEPAGHYGSAFG